MRSGILGFWDCLEGTVGVDVVKIFWYVCCLVYVFERVWNEVMVAIDSQCCKYDGV
jgi:hypothetical protein